MMTDEQVQFARMLERFANQEYAAPLGVRPFDRDRHVRIAEMGCLSLALPEDLGGFGGPVETMLAMQHLAAKLPKEPIVASGVHGAALLSATRPNPVADALLGSIASGERIWVPAIQEANSRYRNGHTQTTARRNGDTWILDGAKHLIEAASQADGLLVTARDVETDALCLFAVDVDAPGLNLTPRSRVDLLSCADIALSECTLPASALLSDSGVEAMLGRASDLAEAAQLGEMVGLMDALLRETIGYVQTRRQFGTEIGRFQALQHRIADMWILCEETRSLALAAALSCDASDEERTFTVSCAKLHACDSARLVANEAVQMHGGIGMTDELVVGHWFKRLLALRASLGDRRFHLERLIDRTNNAH